MSKSNSKFKKITALFLSLVFVISAFCAVDFTAQAKVMNWTAVASSDFTKSADANNYFPTYSTGGSNLAWSIQGSSSRPSEDNALYIPEGYMYMSGFNNQTSVSPLPEYTGSWKIDLGFRFKDDFSVTASDTYCFFRMGVFETLFGDTDNNTYQYSYFAQDGYGNVDTWNREKGTFGTASVNNSISTASKYLKKNENYHYVVEYDRQRLYVYITDDNGVAVQQILASSNSDLISRLENLPNHTYNALITSIKLGNSNRSGNKYSNLEYRNFTIYTGEETHVSGSTGEKYLFAYFTGNADHTSQNWDSQAVRYALSEDGRHFTSINGNMAVVNQQLGTKNNRDPYVFAGQDGYYYMIATDMDCNLKDDGTKGNDWYWWGNSDSMVIWRSSDLITWTDETIINMSEITGADDIQRCWAPQVIWDATAQKYAVYFGLASWSITQNKTVTYYCYTDDLLDQSSYEYPVEMLNPGTGAIDGDIVYNTDNSTYYMYYKNEDAGSIRYAVSKTVTGPYTDKGNVLSAADWYAMGGAPTLAKAALEGSACYFVGDELYMMCDNYENGKMILLKSSDFENFQVLNESDYNTNGFSTTRHASVMRISDAQYNALISAYGDVHYTFHEDFDVHDWAGSHVDPSGYQYSAKTNKSVSDSHIYAFENSNYLSIYKGNLFVEDWTVRHLMSGNSWTMSVNAMVTTKSSTPTPILSLSSGANESSNQDWFRILDNGKITIYDGSTNVEIGETNIDVAVEYTFHVTYDGTDLKVYKNGSLVCTRSNWTNNYKVTDSTNYIGVGFSDRTNSNSDYFRGTIADLRFRMHALSPAEISSEYSDKLFYTAEGNETLDDLPNSISSKYDGSYRSGKANSLTIAGWVNPGDVCDDYALLYIFGTGGDGNTGQYLTLREGGNLNYLWGDGTSQHKVDITGVATYTANKWTYIQINIIPYRNSVRITTWQDGVQTTNTYCTETGTNMSGYDYLPISMFTNKTTQDSLPVRYQQNPTSEHSWWSGNGYSNGITVYGRAMENLYTDAEEDFEVAIAKNYVENHIEDYNVEAAANKATRNAYYWGNNVATGGFNNVLACTTTTICDGVWDAASEMNKVKYAFFWPENIVLNYDGVNTPGIPVQLEMHGYTGGTGTNLPTVYCWNSEGGNGAANANWKLAHYWTGTGNTHTTWWGTTKPYPYKEYPSGSSDYDEVNNGDDYDHIGYYPGQAYDYLYTIPTDESGLFFWNKVNFIGEGDSTDYKEKYTSIPMQAYQGSEDPWTNNYRNLPTKTINIYVVNYKPVYDMLKSSGATKVPNESSFDLMSLYEEVETNPTRYTEDSVSDFYLAAYKVLNANPNQFSEATYQADYAGTVDLAAEKIDEAVKAFNAIDLKLRADFTDLDSKYANAQNIVATLNTNNQVYTTSSITALRTVINNLVYEPNDGDPYRPNVEAFASSSAIIAEKDAIDNAVAALDPIYDFDKYYGGYLFDEDYEPYDTYNEIWQYSTDILDTKGTDAQAYTTTTVEALGTVINNCYYAPVLNRVPDRKDIGENKDGAAIAAEVNAMDDAISRLLAVASFSALDTAYNQGDAKLKEISDEAPLYTKASVDALITAVNNASSDAHLDVATRRDTGALYNGKQNSIDGEVSAINTAIAALETSKPAEVSDLSTYRAAADKIRHVDPDIYDTSSFSYELALVSASAVLGADTTYTDASSNRYTISTLDNDIDQDDVDYAVTGILGYLTNNLKTYTITLDANGRYLSGSEVGADPPGRVDGSGRNWTGKANTKAVITAADANTAWYVTYKKGETTTRARRYQGYGDSITLNVLGDMQIEAVQATEDKPNKVTINRNFSDNTTTHGINSIDFAGSTYTLPAAPAIAYYKFDGYSFGTNDGSNDSDRAYLQAGNTITVTNKNTVVKAMYTKVSDNEYTVKVSTVSGNGDVFDNSAAYNTKITASDDSAYAWVETPEGGSARIFAIGSSVTFFVTDSVEIKAITKAQFDAAGYVVPKVNLRASGFVTGELVDGKRKLTFNGQVVHDNAYIVECGILLGKATTGSITNDDMVLANTGTQDGYKLLRAKSTKQVGANQFTIGVTTNMTGEFKYRGYAVYQVGNDIITVYSNVVDASIS